MPSSLLSLTYWRSNVLSLDLTQLAQSIAEGTAEATGDDAHRDDVTALMVAAQGGHVEVAKLLVERGADVRAKDEQLFTPLLNAVKVTLYVMLDTFVLLLQSCAHCC